MVCVTYAKSNAVICPSVCGVSQDNVTANTSDINCASSVDVNVTSNSTTSSSCSTPPSGQLFDPPCLNVGVCFDLHRPDGVQTGYRHGCACKIGYRGRRCQDAVTNICSLGPCDVNGTSECVADRPGAYECHCYGGRLGEFCEDSPKTTSNTLAVTVSGLTGKDA